jgi:transposase
MTDLSLAANPSPRRFAPPRWRRDSPEWQALDRQLAPDHKARLIDAFVQALDLSELEALYRGSGSLAYPPEVMLKVARYETLEGHLAPNAWARHVQEHIPLQWLAQGMAPSRTAWYDFRDRLGPVIEALLADVVATGQRAGFVPGKQGVLDGTSLRALASRHRLLNAPRLQQRLEALQGAVAADAAGQPLAQRPGWMAETVRGRRDQLRRYQEAKAVLDRRLAENARKPKDRRLAPEKVMVSVSDPVAPLGRDKEKVFCPLYTAQFLVEPCSLLIIAFDVFPRATDAGTLPPMLDQAQRTLGRHLDTVITDAGYVSILDLQACAERQVKLIAPIHENDFSPVKDNAPPQDKARAQDPSAAPAQPAIGKDQFPWDATEQTYRCPQGHTLRHVRRQRKARRQEESVVIHQYQCSPTHCQECPLKSRCVKDPSKGRIVIRTEGEELLEAHRLEMATPEAKKLRKLRGQVIERAFGDAKQHRKVRKLHGRGLLRAKAEMGLVVLVQNALMLHRLRRNAVNSVETAA